MGEGFSASIICESEFLRDIISDSLQDHGVDILYVGATFPEESPNFQSDVIVLVETLGCDLLKPCENVQRLVKRYRRWLVIGSSEEGSLFRRLQAERSDISGAPLSIGKDEIYHAVALAAGSNPICIGDTFRQCPSIERHILNEAALDERQWDILSMLANGASNKLIAKHFDCDESKVKAMIRRLLMTIGASNRTQAAVMAARAGL